MNDEKILRNRRVWTSALRSGQFPQGTEYLGSGPFCCLGVGCKVLGIPYNPEEGLAPAAFMDAVGLGNSEGEYDGCSLVTDNDERGLTFPEIADIIDNTPTLWAEHQYHQDWVSPFSMAAGEK